MSLHLCLSDFVSNCIRHTFMNFDEFAQEHNTLADAIRHAPMRLILTICSLWMPVRLDILHHRKPRLLFSLNSLFKKVRGIFKTINIDNWFTCGNLDVVLLERKYFCELLEFIPDILNWQDCHWEFESSLLFGKICESLEKVSMLKDLMLLLSENLFKMLYVLLLF